MIYAQIALALIPLLILIYNQYFSAKALKDAQNKAFETLKTELIAHVNDKLKEIQAQSAAISQGQASGWDAADADAKKV